MEADAYFCLCKLLEGIQDNYTYAQPGIQRTVFSIKELVRCGLVGIGTSACSLAEHHGMQLVPCIKELVRRAARAGKYERPGRKHFSVQCGKKVVCSRVDLLRNSLDGTLIVLCILQCPLLHCHPHLNQLVWASTGGAVSCQG